jgi:hypothetical protein
MYVPNGLGGCRWPSHELVANHRALLVGCSVVRRRIQPFFFAAFNRIVSNMVGGGGIRIRALFIDLSSGAAGQES